ncbi:MULTISPECIES: RDD family protein [Streptomyces]|uniref:RDD family protein n=1 Tax=Streptomyces fimbriatus TaxID=68197 RepID=A0ABW0D1W0_STRFI
MPAFRRAAAWFIDFGLLIAAAFLYQWVCLALLGRTLGKGLTGLKVTPRTPGRAALRAAVTTAADVAVYAAACVLLIEGHVVPSVLVWAVAVALFLGNALPALSPARRSLADRVAGTAVTGPGPDRPDLGLSRPGAMPPVRTS